MAKIVRNVMNPAMVEKTTLQDALEQAAKNSVKNKGSDVKVSRKRFQELVDDRVRLRQRTKALERENAALGDNLEALRKRYGDLSAGFLEISECYFSLLGLLSQLTELRGDPETLDKVYALVVKGAEAFFHDPE